MCLFQNSIADQSVFSAMKRSPFICPLYIYPETYGQFRTGLDETRTPNLNPEIVNQLAKKISLTFTNEKQKSQDSFAPIDILDYIYAVLHSPSYRDTYKEFLKIDFPRVPYPADQKAFWHLVGLGSELGQIHLLESSVIEKPITQYPENGSNIVEKTWFESGEASELGKVYINPDQYFANVPRLAWEFYIGGYQPAQK